MRYLTRAVPVDIEHWTDVENPPPGVHDLFFIPGEQPAGYLSTHEGDKIVHLGDHIVYYPDGHRESMSLQEIAARFVKDE